MMRRYLVSGLIAAMIATPACADVTVGVADDVNCIPFGCAATLKTTSYQQVYAAGSFTTPVTISALTFFMGDRPAGTYDGSTFIVSFYYSAAAPNALSTSESANEGQQIANFGLFVLLGPQQSTLTLSGTAFAYDPARGNLLMNVDILHSLAGSASYFQEDISGLATSRVFGTDSAAPFADSKGLVTRFTTQAAIVPEAPTWAMLLGGFALVGGALRRRRPAAVTPG